MAGAGGVEIDWETSNAAAYPGHCVLYPKRKISQLISGFLFYRIVVR